MEKFESKSEANKVAQSVNNSKGYELVSPVWVGAYEAQSQGMKQGWYNMNRMTKKYL